jgi:hypothetical protein
MQTIIGHVRVGVALSVLIGVWACSSEQTSPTQPAEGVNPQAHAVALVTRADSAALLRNTARSLALALADPKLRTQLKAALARTRVREGKLHVQRFLHNRGANFGRAVGLANRLGERGWADAIERLPDLEMYLPIPKHRETWAATEDLLVAGFLETDEEIRARGGRTAYTTRGEGLLIPYGEVPSRPVLVIYPSETDFGPTGEEPQRPTVGALAAAPAAVARIIFPPPQPAPAGPCGSETTTDVYVYICKIGISNVGQYEESLRGAPEVAILTRAVTVNTSNVPTSWTDIGCNNEDKTDWSRFNMDNDTWMGRARVAPRTTFQSQQAAGKRIFIMVWEDDNGSKCDFQPENTTSPRNVSWATMMRFANIFTLAGIADGLDGNPGGWLLASIAGVLSSVFGMFATSGDDLIGSVALPAGSDPGKSVKDIRVNEGTIVGTMSFLID